MNHSPQAIARRRYWSEALDDTAAFLETDAKAGLSSAEVQVRMAVFGRNAIETSKKSSWLRILFEQLKSPLILVLIAAGIVTLLIAHYRDSMFIFVAVVVNSLLGFYQENKAERALAELTTYLKQRARVIREGSEREMDAEELVPGDLIRLSQGDRVPADARVVYANDFQVDEAVLTGESLPVGKSSEPVKEEAGLGDQRSMVFAGTLVTQGVCTALVCRTDSDTELGKIAALLAQSQNEQTPLQKSIISLSVYSSFVLGGLTLIVFVIGLAAGYSLLEMFLTSVAIAVSAIPEGLPISMTVILAVGVERMARRKGVVRKLVAAEALGSTTVILTDKTGTLTEAKMVLAQVIPLHAHLEESRLLRRALCNADVLIENPEEQPQAWRISGRIMESALVRASALRGMSLQEITGKEHVLQSLPFNATQKYSVSLIKEGDRHKLVYFGAPDILLSHSELSEQDKESVYGKIEALASSGERVLGIATKEVAHAGDYSLSHHHEPAKLSFDGLITFRDPIRQGVRHVIGRIGYAGVKTVIMTGDHHGTAVSVAREVGIDTDREGAVLDATELVSMSDEQLCERLPKLSVIARVTPIDKLRIAKAYQSIGAVVAMTGDGVNDAPSIKQADVGIAMGSGTEVAQSVADLVLLDDNYETIVAAIEEGRQIFGNLRKVLVYLLSNSFTGLILIGGSLLTSLPLPLNALQILWVNFFTDSFPAVAFAFEKEQDALSHKPHDPKRSLFDPLMRFLVLVLGIATSALLFVLYFALMKLGFDEALVRTFTFAAFGTYTLLVALSVRSLEHGIFTYSFISNPYLLWSIIIGFALMAAAIYVPLMQTLLDTVALPAVWAAAVLGVGLVNIALIETSKYFFRVRHR